MVETVAVAVDDSIDTPTFKKIVVLGCILVCNNISLWMIFSFLPFMVHDFYPNLTLEEVGYKAGMLGSSFSCGSLLGNYVWGQLSDRIGRRLVLMYGLLGTCICSLLFGFSSHFYMAMLSRFLWGLLNGNVAVSKTYMAEILTDANNARGMSLFGVIGGFGRTIGPIIGGFLSSPADNYNVFKHTIFATYPYALPSIVIAFCCICTMIMSYFELTETLDLSKTQGVHAIAASGVDDSDYSSKSSSSNSISSKSSGSSSSHSSSIYIKVETDDDNNYIDTDDSTNNNECTHNNDDHDDSDDVGIALLEQRKHPKSVSFSSIVMVKKIGSESLGYGNLKAISPTELPISVPSSGKADFTSVLRYTNGSMDENTSNTDSDDNDSEYDDYIAILQKEHRGCSRILHLMSRSDILISAVLLGFNGLISISISEVFSLWVVTAKSIGGFSYSAQYNGTVITITGPIIMMAQLYLYPAISKKLGVLRTYKVASILLGIVAVLTPCVSMVNSLNAQVLSDALIVLSLSMLGIVSQWCLISNFIFVNNSCWSHERGTVNGIAQSFSSLGRLIGPVTIGNIFAWSENNNLSWPMNYYFAWYLLAALISFCALICTQLSSAIDRRKRETKRLSLPLRDTCLNGSK